MTLDGAQHLCLGATDRLLGLGDVPINDLAKGWVSDRQPLECAWCGKLSFSLLQPCRGRLFSIEGSGLAMDNESVAFDDKLREMRCCAVFALASDDPLAAPLDHIFGTT